MPIASTRKLAWSVCLVAVAVRVPSIAGEEIEQPPVGATIESQDPESEVSAKPDSTKKEKKKSPAALQFGATIDGRWAWEDQAEENQLYVSVLPFLSFENDRFAYGGSLRYADVNLENGSLDDGRGEVDASWRWNMDKKSPTQIFRAIGYFARGSIDDDAAAGTVFDRSGMYNSYGVKIRSYSKVDSNDFSGTDGLFQDPKSVYGWSVGVNYRDARTSGPETEYRELMSHGDARWWFRRIDESSETKKKVFTRNMVRVAGGYGFVRYPHRTLSTDDTDTLSFAQATWNFRLPHWEKHRNWSWDIVAGVERVWQQSAAEAFNVSTTNFTAGIHINFLSFRPFRAPDNDDSSTVSPSDLGPPRPRPGP